MDGGTMMYALIFVALVGVFSVLFLIKNRKISKDHVFFTDRMDGEDETPSNDDDPPPTEEEKKKMDEERAESHHFDVYK